MTNSKNETYFVALVNRGVSDHKFGLEVCRVTVERTAKQVKVVESVRIRDDGFAFSSRLNTEEPYCSVLGYRKVLSQDDVSRLKPTPEEAVENALAKFAKVVSEAEAKALELRVALNILRSQEEEANVVLP